jgi:F-type H+-transporting ATPase subunit b
MFTPEAMAGYVSTAILTIVNLLVTYFILKRFLFKPILNILRKRKTEVEAELSDAAEKLKAAEDKLTDATDRLNNTNHEAAMIITTAKSQAEIQRESIMSDAKHEIAGMYSRADSEISRMKVTMLNDVRDEVADLSVAIASKVIGQAMDDQRQRELIERFMDDQMRTKRGEA